MRNLTALDLEELHLDHLLAGAQNQPPMGAPKPAISRRPDSGM
jgi:hypothetical protein